MESIQQFELILMSKMETSSPKCSIIEDLPFDDDNFANDNFFRIDELTGIDFLAELDKDEKLYLDELQQITEKIDLPLYDLMNGNDGSGNNEMYNTTAIVPTKTEQLLMDFDSLYDGVEIDHMTPPQTPPEQKFFGVEDHQYVQNIPNIEQQQFVFEFDQQQSPVQEQQYIYVPNAEEDFTTILESSNDGSMTSCDIDPEPIILSPTDIQLEQEIVDEIIQAHSRSQSDYDDATSSSSSWSPRSSDYSPSICSFDGDITSKRSSTSRGVSKRRTRPYGRNPEEKKSRKKEQNKNAATRYRQKKKEEVCEILGEERGLMDRNKKLLTAFNDTKREVKYLKSLLKELFQARGFIQ